MNKSKNSNVDLKLRQDQIRIALSAGIIAFYFFLFNKLFSMELFENTENMTPLMYFISCLVYRGSVITGLIAIGTFALYIICLSSKYTYQKTPFVSDKLIENLYDNGIRVFWAGVLFSVYLSYILLCCLILKKYYFYVSAKIKDLVLGIAIFLFFLVFLIIGKIIKKYQAAKNE